jgi:hypothetical protein
MISSINEAFPNEPDLSFVWAVCAGTTGIHANESVDRGIDRGDVTGLNVVV